MSVLSEAKNFLSLIKAEPRDWVAIATSARTLFTLLIGTGVEIPTFGDGEGESPAELKAVFKEISAIIPSLNPPLEADAAVGKLGDGKLLEVMKLVLPLIIKFLPFVL